MIEVWLIVTLCAAVVPSVAPYGQQGPIQAHECTEYRSADALGSFGQCRLEQARLLSLALGGRRVTASLCSRTIARERVAELPPLSAALGDHV